MTIEDAFEVHLEDGEAAKMRTPGDLIECLWRKVQHADATACLTQRSFNLVRAALRRQLPLQRRDLKPTARLDDLIPKARRGPLHQQLPAELGTPPLPQLERPAWVLGLCAAGALTTGFLAARNLYVSGSSQNGGLTILAGVAVAAFVQMLAWFATAPLRQHFPPAIATVGDFARWVAAVKTELATRPQGRWTREQVAARVRQIVIEQLNCAADYREDADFVKDFGLS